jgi:hypothetical protein
VPGILRRGFSCWHNLRPYAGAVIEKWIHQLAAYEKQLLLSSGPNVQSEPCYCISNLESNVVSRAQYSRDRCEDSNELKDKQLQTKCIVRPPALDVTQVVLPMPEIAGQCHDPYAHSSCVQSVTLIFNLNKSTQTHTHRTGSATV